MEDKNPEYMILKVWKRNDGAHFVTIPRDKGIEEGDYVKIKKIEE